MTDQAGTISYKVTAPTVDTTESLAKAATMNNVRLPKTSRIQVDVKPTLESLTPADLEGCTDSDCYSQSGTVAETADAVIVSRKGPDLQVLMINRVKAPFTSLWALPGGRLNAGEDFSSCADREMFEEVGVDPAQFTDLAAKSGVRVRLPLGDIVKSFTWDPRFMGTRIGAVLYVVPSNAGFIAGDDAAHAQWVRAADLASGKQPLAFEHATWLARAFAAPTDVHDSRLAEAFTTLALAARVRNRTLVDQVNDHRQRNGYPPITYSTAQAQEEALQLSKIQKTAAVNAMAGRAGAREDWATFNTPRG